MTDDIPRRAVLSGLSMATAVGLGGCTAITGTDNGDDVPTCSMYGHDAERNAPLRKARVTTRGEDRSRAKLEVVLDAAELEETNAAVINAYNPQDEDRNPEHTIPIHRGPARSTDESSDGETVTKQTSVDPTPATGELRVEVQDDSGDVLAFEQFSFECA